MAGGARGEPPGGSAGGAPHDGLGDHEALRALFERASAGDAHARDELIAILYGLLHRIAGGHMRRQHRSHTLQATALVHEAVLRLRRAGPDGWRDEASLLQLAGTAMRQVLVDHARSKDAAKRRPPGERVPLDDGQLPLDELLESYQMTPRAMGALGSALDELARFDPRAVRVIEQRFFLGCTIEETAANLGTSVRTVERDWTSARAWLRGQLGE